MKNNVPSYFFNCMMGYYVLVLGILVILAPELWFKIFSLMMMAGLIIFYYYIKNKFQRMS